MLIVYAVFNNLIRTAGINPFFKYNYLRTLRTYQFNTFKVLDQEEEKPAANRNPFAVITLRVLLALKRKTILENESFKQKIELAKNLLQRKILIAKVRSLVSFLK